MVQAVEASVRPHFRWRVFVVGFCAKVPLLCRSQRVLVHSVTAADRYSTAVHVPIFGKITRIVAADLCQLSAEPPQTLLW